jgi:hypothetical protein
VTSRLNPNLNAFASSASLLKLWQSPSLALAYSEREWSQVLRALRHTKLTARYAWWLAQHLHTSEFPAFVQRHFANATVIATRHAKQVHFELTECQRIFAQSQQPWLVLKGAAYTASQGSVGEGRIYNDIDIWVPSTAIHQTERMLSIHGWLAQDVDDYDDRYYREWAHEIPPLQHGYRGTVMDLHHNIVPLVSGRAPDMQILLAERQLTAAGIPVLMPAAQAMHSAIHLFFNEECEYITRDLLDLILLLQDFTEHDWAAFIRLARALAFPFEARLALYFVEHYGQISLPDGAAALLGADEPHLQHIARLYHALLEGSHPVSEPLQVRWARLAIALRGHYLKMPPRILAYHVAMKSYRNIVKLCFGEHVFTKQDENTLRVQGPQAPKPRMEM